MKLVADRYVDESTWDTTSWGPEVIDLGGGSPQSEVNRWLAFGLAVAVLVVGVLGGWLWVDHRQSVDENEIAVLVSTNARAWDSGDGAGVLATMTRGSTWEVQSMLTGRWTPWRGPPLVSGSAAGSPIGGPQLAEFVRSLALQGFTLRLIGPAAIVGGHGWWMVAQPNQVSFGPGYSTYNGLNEFVVVEIAGRKLIEHEVYLPLSAISGDSVR